MKHTRRDPYPLFPPLPLERPIMRQRWADVTFVHFPFDAAEVQRLLPDGLTVDVFDGTAWVGLVPFRMERIRGRIGPSLPYVGTFPETNVRTYVIGPDGRRGVWFHSLDVTRLLPVIVARTGYRLPYAWSRMRIDRRPDGALTYTARRRWPRATGSESLIRVRPGPALPTSAIGPLERFLTARWGLWTVLGSTLAYAPVDHPPWPLHAGELTAIDDRLMNLAGYAQPIGAPLVHYSPGVDVGVGLPRRI